jgi:membrane protein
MKILKKNFLKSYIDKHIRKQRSHCRVYCERIAAFFVRFFKEGYSETAAGLSFVSLLALVPLATLMFTILTAFPALASVEDKIQKFIFANFVTSSAQALQNYLQWLIAQTVKLSITGTIGLLITAVLLIFSVEYAFNRIWKVAKHRHPVQAFLLYWAVLTLLPILVGAGFAFSAHFASTTIESNLANFPWLESGLALIFVYFLTFLVFYLLYLLVPNCKVMARQAAIGALVATVLFEVIKYLFTLYIINLANYTIIYGALAIIPIFLVWLYVAWLIVLFGAFVSARLINND